LPAGFKLAADHAVNDESTAKDQNRDTGPKDKDGHMDLLLLPGELTQQQISGSTPECGIKRFSRRKMPEPCVPALVFGRSAALLA
jgi:hypothetical protein